MLVLVCYACCGEMCDLFVLVCLFWYLLPTLDSNDTGFSEEGEVVGYQDKDQGQAEQGKPSKLDSYLILVLLPACFIVVYELA
jgi:hypothetical protein